MADLWSPPSGATAQQFPNGRDPNNGLTTLLAEFAALKTEVKEMRSSTLKGLQGLIDNAMLANPLAVEPFGETASGYTVTTSAINAATATLTVPEGMTIAAVIATSAASSRHDGAGILDMLLNPRIQGVDGSPATLEIPSGGYRYGNTTFAHPVTGLTPGNTLTINTRVQGSTTGEAGTGWASINGLVIWTR